LRSRLCACTGIRAPADLEFSAFSAALPHEGCGILLGGSCRFWWV
jgi:hypothetical protein